MLHNSSNDLTEYEKSEILQYPEVYYWGHNMNCCLPLLAKVDTRNQDGLQNFDDENGDYVAKRGDHIAYRYEILEPLGSGSFGQVYKVRDARDNTFAAIKIIRNKSRYTRQGEIEIRLLANICEWDKDSSSGCVRMIGNFTFRNHLCIVFELLGQNLYRFMKSCHFVGLPMLDVKYFAWQMLRCLSFLHNRKLLHCDLKPENILLISPDKRDIRVIDFGSSCMLSEKSFTYIQSRFYRSPEVILGAPYDMAIDMWSFGCIVVELAVGTPIFGGENEVDQFWRIMEVLGMPDKELLNIATKKKEILGDDFDTSGPNAYVQHHTDSTGHTRFVGRSCLERLAAEFSYEFFSFVEGCLRWNPQKRFTPLDGLSHPFLASVRERKIDMAPAVKLQHRNLALVFSPPKSPTRLTRGWKNAFQDLERAASRQPYVGKPPRVAAPSTTDGRSVGVDPAHPRYGPSYRDIVQPVVPVGRRTGYGIPSSAYPMKPRLFKPQV